jgi:hypothetical protein
MAPWSAVCAVYGAFAAATRFIRGDTTRRDVRATNIVGELGEPNGYRQPAFEVTLG